MCTEKASIKWRDIHRIIHSKIRVYEIDRSEVFQEIMIDYYNNEFSVNLSNNNYKIIILLT